MRDRAWRRHIEEKVVLSRLRRLQNKRHWWFVEDANGYWLNNAIIADYIGTGTAHMYKTIKTTYKSDKSKYSPNKTNNRNGSCSWGRSGETPNTREFQTRELVKVKQEYGLK